MTITTEEELTIVREGGRRLAAIRDALAKKTVAGVTTLELNELAHELCTRDVDSPAFLAYSPLGATRSFPVSLCISVNDVVVHCIPTENPQTLREGDIVTLDVGLVHRGIVTDTAVTVAVGEVRQREKELIETAEIALSKAIGDVRPGAHVGDISKT